MAPPADTAAEEFLQLYGEAAWQDWQRLLAHFDLGEGFAFLVLLLPGAVGANICQRQLSAHLASKGKTLAVLPCEWREEARQIAERLFSLEPIENLGGIWLGSVIPDSDPEIDRWKEAWGTGLTLLNQRRNALRRRFACPLVLVGAPWLHSLLREVAPDLWSVRTAVVAVTPSAQGVTPSEEFRPALGPAHAGLMGEAASDPDYALEQAERLRDRPGLEASRAGLLVRAATGFYEHARLEPAEQCLREAARLLTKLASTSPDLQAGLAAALNNLSTVLSALGRREEALAQAQAALRLYRQMTQARPGAFAPSVAMSLNNLANMLSALGRREQALAQAQEAVHLYRQLAQDQPDAFLPDLARSLNNLANKLSALGRQQEALAQAQEAVRIRRQLAQDRPDAFLPDLAGSLNNLAVILSGLGRREEALEQAQEAVRLYRRLTQERPDAFLSNLAASLNTLANMLSALGRYEEAVAQAQDAVRFHRQLAEARPDAFLPALATSLSNLANRLSALGRQEDALAKAQEALRIRRQLAQAQPDAFLPDLAASLSNLANILSTMGRREEALAQAQEAVRLYRELAQVRPEVFLADLGRSLAVQGICLSAVGRHLDAIPTTSEAIRLLAPAFAEVPAAFAQLMRATVQLYLDNSKAAKQSPDMEMLAPVLDVLGRLDNLVPGSKPMEYLQLLDQTIELLKPVAPAGGQVVTKLAANALWDWIKTKVKGSSPAATEAVDEVEKAPANPVNWDALRVQLREALAENETLRTELAALLAKHTPAPAVAQHSAVSGQGNVVIQTTGSGNIDVQR